VTKPRASRLAAGLLALVAGCGSGGSSVRPSILLFVFDTTRVDAVSAYGQVSGTTPTADALAATGLRYAHAYAQAPWTLPSHATLFTGLLPSQHQVTFRRPRASDALVTLAERLRDAGYETVGVTENPWTTAAFNLTQGFQRFTPVAQRSREVDGVLATWLAERPRGRPFFLFVNVMDAHGPYPDHPDNPFLPEPASVADVRKVLDGLRSFRLCASTLGARERAIVWGTYLAGVAAADAKLRLVLDRLRGAGLDRDLVTIVTSDHGEQFGEHGFVDHIIGVHEELVHVPLVVHGVPGATPAVIDAPVALADVMPSVLGWAGVAAGGPFAGRPLPTTAGAARDPRDVVAEHVDPEGTLGGPGAKAVRRACGPDDRVWGDIRALVRYPLKLVWYEHYPAALFDLARDPRETNDLAGTQPDAVATLAAALAQQIAAIAPVPDVAPAAPAGGPPPDVVERLRALGYLRP
jgi:arylsulfatase A-like enzyme